ncbi:hypothetical protein P8452_61817 [Trifolium repens]|nr:hypothetical protein P8452_61817 [Trifolium repens]
MASSDHQQTRKRLIIKLSFPHGSQKDDSQDQGGNKKRRMEKPIVSCYWLDANLPLKKNNKNIEDQLSISSTIGAQHTKEELVKENSKFSAKEKPSSSFIKYHPASDENCCLKKNNDGNGETVRAEKKKKPMEHYKRMQCWVIVKRMIEGKDGWALKAPLDIKFLKGGLENKSKVKKKAIGLKDIEGKLKSYSSPDEFADDMRFVFYHGLCYPRRDDVYRIAARLSDTFEHKWKVLKKEWEREEKRLRY